MGCRVNCHMGTGAFHLTRKRMNFRNSVNFVTEKFNSVGSFRRINRENFNCVATDTEFVSYKIDIIALVLHKYKLLKQADGMTRFLHVNDGAGNTPVNRKIYDLDDVEIVKVPTGRFKSAYDFSDGFTPAGTAKQINAILIHPNSVVARERYAYIKMFAPGTDSRTGDGYIYQNRKYGDLFVLAQRVAGIAINADA